MALSEDKSAPYAPTAAIASILDRNRSTGLPPTINKDTLTRLGISDSLNARTLQALNVLDLIDEEGGQTETLKALRATPEGDYRQRLEEWLNAAYADILQYVDPSEGNETAVMDAFRPYKPNSMLGRMVTLFTGLYGLAGVWPEEAQRAKVERPARTAVTRKRPTSPVKVSAEPSAAQSTLGGSSSSNPHSGSRSEVALEYRLVDLMGEASGDKDVMDAIVTLITFLKTRGVPRVQIPNYNKKED